MNRADYDKIPALNFSKAKLLLRSPSHYMAGLWEPDDPEKYAVGKLVHAMVLEGKDLRNTYVVRPKGMDYRSNAGKAWRDAQTLPIIIEGDNEKIPKMADAIAMHSVARQALSHCKDRELVVVTTMSGVKVKCMVDMSGFDADGRLGFVDIKSTLDARPEFFAKRCASEPFHYDMQNEWYGSLLVLKHQIESRPWSLWIAVESKPPFAVACYAPDETMIASGVEKMRDALTTFKACQASGNWPGYHLGIQLISAPRWRMNQLASL